ncbi:MAG: Na+/H+ antiporter subunit E [Terrimicrobiaceae bacterium]
MSALSKDFPPASSRSVLIRLAVFLAIWVVLAGADPVGLLVGLVTAAAAAWTSLDLLPPSPRRLRIFPLASLGRHFIWGSIVAGVDVAWRAFHPRLPVRPGFVTYACRVPAGTTRDLFLAMTSLMPGSLPTEVDERGVLLMHCLDTDQPLADQMADTEARLLRALEQRAANA